MEQKINNRSAERQSFWARHIEFWKNSNSTQAEYCRENNLDEHLFSKWKIRLNKSKKKKSEKFIEIKSPENILIKDDIELVVKDKYKIKLKPDFDKESLKEILSMLEG